MNILIFPLHAPEQPNAGFPPLHATESNFQFFPDGSRVFNPAEIWFASQSARYGWIEAHKCQYRREVGWNATFCVASAFSPHGDSRPVPSGRLSRRSCVERHPAMLLRTPLSEARVHLQLGHILRCGA